MNTLPQNALLVAGWKERIALPDWGVHNLRAKLDTGARTSAIHVAQIEDLDEDRVRFQVVLRERPTVRTLWVESAVFRRAVVKPSSGVQQHRTVCKALWRLGSVQREIEISLVCRKGMLCRMLIGRKALAGAILVDPNAKYLLSKNALKKEDL